MIHEHGPWRVLSQREVYRDPWMDVRVDQVIRPDGNPGTYSTVRIKPGVCVIAIDEKDNLYLTEEFHYAVGRWTIEGVSGGLELGEEPIVGAQRELREELGILAKEWISLGVVDPLTAAVESPTELFLARDLSFVPTEMEGSEVIRTVIMSLNESLQRIESREITHAPTCVAILKTALKRSL